MAEMFSNLVGKKNNKLQILEAQQTQGKMNTKKTTPWLSRKKYVTYRKHSAINNRLLGKPLVVQWLGLRSFTSKDTGLFSGWGTKIPQAVQCSRRKNQNTTDFLSETGG